MANLTLGLLPEDMTTLVQGFEPEQTQDAEPARAPAVYALNTTNAKVTGTVTITITVVDGDDPAATISTTPTVLNVDLDGEAWSNVGSVALPATVTDGAVTAQRYWSMAITADLTTSHGTSANHGGIIDLAFG